MTYEEFTALAKRKITTGEYYEIVEPVYNYHPAIEKGARRLYVDLYKTIELND